MAAVASHAPLAEHLQTVVPNHVESLSEAVVAKLCSCYGVRSCAFCRDPAVREAHAMYPIRPEVSTASGVLCLEAEGGPTVRFSDGRVLHANELPVPFTGFELLHDAIIDSEAETTLLSEIGAWPWQPSQSGRLKQDFGPRANFKRRQVKIPDDWHGLPRYAHGILKQLRIRCSTLDGFEVAECLALRYDSDRGANHALHTDDRWLWGDRIVGVSLRSSSAFTFYEPSSQLCLRVPLPQRSAYVLSGMVRSEWQHGILAEDIQDVRIVLTFRELTTELISTDVGQTILERARGIVEPPPCGEPLEK